MSIEVTMPALSPTMVSGTLARWLVKVGEKVRSGDVIAEIETDKATMEVEAIEDGVVANILVEGGVENIAVGAVIAILAQEGESLENFVEKANPAPIVILNTLPTSTQDPVDLEVIPAAPTVEYTKKIVDEKRFFVTPLARRMAAIRGILLENIKGSGPHGRILRHDVETADQSKLIVEPELRSNKASNSAHEGVSSLIVNSPMRMTIASRLQESKQQAPHFYLTVDCCIDQLMAARQALNKKVSNVEKVSLNDLIIKAAATALIAVPEANVAWEGEHTRYFNHADIAIAVAIDGGLVTPIVWGAETLGLAALSKKTAELAGRARDGKLKVADYTGGSFTISNLGMFGIREFAAVINPPQGAILAVGVGEERAIVKDGVLAVALMMTVTLSADHRAVDGVVAARWIQAFKEFIEDPVTMLL